MEDILLLGRANIDNKIFYILKKLIIGNTKSFIHAKTLATVENDINPLKTSVSSGKAAIASAVTDKGIQTAADATFQTMADNIRKIQSITSGASQCVIYTVYFPTIQTNLPTTFTIPEIKNFTSYPIEIFGICHDDSEAARSWEFPLTMYATYTNNKYKGKMQYAIGSSYNSGLWYPSINITTGIFTHDCNRYYYGSPNFYNQIEYSFIFRYTS